MQKLRRKTDIWGRKASSEVGNDLGFSTEECGGGRSEEVILEQDMLYSHDFVPMPTRLPSTQ